MILAGDKNKVCSLQGGHYFQKHLKLATSLGNVNASVNVEQDVNASNSTWNALTFVNVEGSVVRRHDCLTFCVNRFPRHLFSPYKEAFFSLSLYSIFSSV